MIRFLKVSLLSIVLLICDCEMAKQVGQILGPYQILPQYYELSNRINKIALYPLHYTDDGEEPRFFGMVFSMIFFDEIMSMPTIRPIQFIKPDSTISLLRSKGISIIGREGKLENLTTIPLEKRSMAVRSTEVSNLQSISEEVDGLLFCDLLLYTEVTFTEEVVPCILPCLAPFFGKPAPTKNEVNMKITLFETSTGEPIWEYTPELRTSLPEGEQRENFSLKITEGFKKYFPLSKSYKSK